MAETEKNQRFMGQDFTSGVVWKQLVIFTLPFLLACLLNSLYNTVDMIIIGQFVGSVGTVAVSLGGKMLDLFTNVSNGLASGGQVLISQLIGAKKREEINSAVGTMFTEMISISVGISVLCLLLSKRILIWLNTPEESFAAALSYLRITCAGLPLIFGYNAVSSVLRGMGDSKSPLLFIGIAAGTNLVLDIVFIVVFEMGATGTALATVMGQGVSLVCSVRILYKKRAEFGFDFRLASFRPDREKLKVILKVGVPLGARFFFIQGTQLVVMSMVNEYGLVQAAAFGIGDKMVHLLNVVAISTRQAACSMVGQNIGAGLLERVKQIVHACHAVALTAACVISAVSLLFPEFVFGLFTRDAEVLAYAWPFMLVATTMYIISALMLPYEAVIMGTGNGRLSFINGILDGVIFRLAFSLLFGVYFKMEVIGFYLGNTLGRLGPLLMGGIYYYSGAWKRFQKLV